MTRQCECAPAPRDDRPLLRLLPKETSTRSTHCGKIPPPGYNTGYPPKQAPATFRATSLQLPQSLKRSGHLRGTARNAPVRAGSRNSGGLTTRHTLLAHTNGLNLRPRLTSWFHPFAYKRFHVLLNSLFKVLCNFPSRYLFAIGLAVIFSLSWSLPAALGCTLKQPDSSIPRFAPAARTCYGTATHCGKVLFRGTCTARN
jgi:hypothetical protein